MLAGLSLRARILAEALGAAGRVEARDAAALAAGLPGAVGMTRHLARALSIDPPADPRPCVALSHLARVTASWFRVEVKASFSTPCRECAPWCRERDRRMGIPIQTVHICRIAQEAIRNAVEHGDAREVELRFGPDASGFALEIQDRGTGLAAQEPSHGIGRRIMEQRARELGGTLRVISQPGQGCTVRCHVPRATGGPVHDPSTKATT